MAVLNGQRRFTIYIKLDFKSGLPIYIQMMRQIKYAIAKGELHSGQKLPSIRELAATLRINPNTVAKGYHELERENAITTRQGLGVFVADNISKLANNEKEKVISETVDYLLGEAFQLGIDEGKLITIIKNRINILKGKAKK